MQILNLFDGNIKFIRAAVLNLEKILALPVKFESFDAEILPNAVIDVNDVIAWLNVAEMFNFVARALESLFASLNLSAEDIFLREDG